MNYRFVVFLVVVVFGVGCFFFSLFLFKVLHWYQGAVTTVTVIQALQGWFSGT